MEQNSTGMHPMSEEDRAVFRRVWRRVMPEDRTDCPFLLDDEPERPPAVQEEQPSPMPPRPTPTAPPEEPWATPLPVMPPPEEVHMPDQPVEVLPAPVVGHPSQHTPAPAGATQPSLVQRREGTVRCLGEAAAPQGPGLISAIDADLSALRRFTALARQTSGSTARALTNLAADARRSAKRLSTAYFLIAGANYFPENRGQPPGRLNVMTELRGAFRDAQSAGAHLVALAEETADPCLAELAMELAGGQAQRAMAVRELLEQL